MALTSVSSSQEIPKEQKNYLFPLVLVTSPFFDTTEEDFDRVVNVNCFAYLMAKGAAAAMTLPVAKDYIKENIRCISISPAPVHTPFADGFLQKNYPGKEKVMFEKLSKPQPIGRMATPEEVAALALYLCSDEASFIKGSDYPIEGGFLKPNT